MPKGDAGKAVPAPPKYAMTISRLTVDKLGVKLYDRVSAVIAEVVANSYDADATEVTVSAPMGELLAVKHEGVLKDKGYTIEVKDNGIGMTPDEVNKFYLKVGGERRKDSKRGDTSKLLKRKVMGRKGVGKLAPLGICERIEVITSGGEKVKEGKKSGFMTAHIIMIRKDMLKDDDANYIPEIGSLDGTLQPETGTTVKMTVFDHRHVPEINDFERQLAQRFGLESPQWKLTLRDSQMTATATDGTRVVGRLNIDLKAASKIVFREELTLKKKSYDPPKYSAFDENDEVIPDIKGSFDYEGVTYPVTGWVAYSKLPYRDDLMAGVRIYCRGKIAAQTHIFNMKAGFTGEYDIRSYLVGVLNADWLDEEEDLIRTDRQDILWSFPLAKAFEEWGQKIVKRVGSITREPIRQTNWDTFVEETDFEEKVQKIFPADDQREIRERTTEIAKTIVKAARPDELQEEPQRNAMVELALLVGPHITLEKKLIEAAESQDRTLAVVTDILRIARVAELSSFGRIADDRVKVIKKVEELKSDSNTLEDAFQALIEQAPWLINPQWSPITDNESLASLKKEFVNYFKAETGDTLVLYGASSSGKRPDFVLTNQDKAIEIIVIKRPDHPLNNPEMDRIVTYHDAMDSFLHTMGREEYLKSFEKFHITLVCDSVSLKGAQKVAFDGLQASGGLTQVTWGAFLKRTRKMHEAFLHEAERQRLNAANR